MDEPSAVMTPALRILITSDPELPVPPRLYGGIERVVALLAEGLVSRGHDVRLVAHAESTVQVRLVPYPSTSSRGASATVRHAALIAGEVRRWQPDVIQSFGRLAYLAPLLPLRVPKVMSYQRVVTENRIRWAHRLSRGTLHFTGCSQALVEPVQHVGRWRVIHNAVPVDRFVFSPEVASNAPLAFLGRIEPIKGPHVAIRAARAAGRRLVMAGNLEPSHAEFFRREIQPSIDDEHVSYLGPVDDGGKSRLLSGAAALLMPIGWDEPFGIVMAEALACGTPVIGFRRGAVPEVIEQGKTGFVCDTEMELADAISRIGALSRRACRAAAEQRFSANALVGAYEALFEEVRLAAGVTRPARERRAAVVKGTH